MSDEPLDEACAKAAYAASGLSSLPGTMCEADILRALAIAARYGREGWTPVDPLLVEAREIVASEFEKRELNNWAAAIREGNDDDATGIAIALAALKAGMALQAKEDGR